MRGCSGVGHVVLDVPHGRSNQPPLFELRRSAVALAKAERTGLTLSVWLFCRSVGIRGSGEEPAAVLEGDTRGVGGRRSIARLIAIDDQHRAGGQILLAPSAPVERIGAAGLPRPLHDLAVLARHVDVD